MKTIPQKIEEVKPNLIAGIFDAFADAQRQQADYYASSAREAGSRNQMVVVEPLPVVVGGVPDVLPAVTTEPLRTIRGDLPKRRYRKYDRPVRARRSPRDLAARVDEIRTGHFEPMGPTEDPFGRPATIYGYFPAGWNRPKYRLITGECLTSCNCPQGRRNIACKHAALLDERRKTEAPILGGKAERDGNGIHSRTSRKRYDL